MIIYDSMDGVAEALRYFGSHKRIRLVRMKNRWLRPTSGGWADILLNVALSESGELPDEGRGVICEVQLVHRHLLTVRTSMGGHHGYSSFRSAEELLDQLAMQRR